MRKEKKNSKSIFKDVAAPIVTQFNHQRVKQFETKSTDLKSNDPFIKGILDITKDLPESPKP